MFMLLNRIQLHQSTATIDAAAFCTQLVISIDRTSNLKIKNVCKSKKTYKIRWKCI